MLIQNDSYFADDIFKFVFVVVCWLKFHCRIQWTLPKYSIKYLLGKEKPWFTSAYMDAISLGHYVPYPCMRLYKISCMPLMLQFLCSQSKKPPIIQNVMSISLLEFWVLSLLLAVSKSKLLKYFFLGCLKNITMKLISKPIQQTIEWDIEYPDWACHSQFPQIIWNRFPEHRYDLIQTQYRQNLGDSLLLYGTWIIYLYNITAYPAFLFKLHWM